MTRKIITMAAWLVLIVLVVATLSPIELRPHSGLPVDFERAAAYGVLGGLLGLAYQRYFPMVALGLTGLILGMEMVQNLLPDRHGQPADAIVKVFGAFVGLGLGTVGSRLIPSRAR